MTETSCTMAIQYFGIAALLNNSTYELCLPLITTAHADSSVATPDGDVSTFVDWTSECSVQSQTTASRPSKVVPDVSGDDFQYQCRYRRLAVQCLRCHDPLILRFRKTQLYNQQRLAHVAC